MWTNAWHLLLTNVELDPQRAVELTDLRIRGEGLFQRRKMTTSFHTRQPPNIRV